MRNLILFFFLMIGTTVFGQNLAINPGVDTTDIEIKAVITLWSNYLGSTPNRDNIMNNIYWAETEKKKYSKVDQLLNAINTDVTTYIMGSPTILYVKPQRDGYFEIKTLFGWSDSLNNIYALCITSVFAKKENMEYKLYNALTINSEKWQTRKVGDIKFHFSKNYDFDITKAEELLQSVNSLMKEWNLKSIPFDYYFAETYEEISHIRGLDYSVGMGNRDKPSGMADTDSKIVFCGGLGENYFHEVVHIYLNELFPKSSLKEGLAVFYGGSLGHNLNWHLARLDNYLKQHTEINLNNLYNLSYTDNYTNPISTIQGLICSLAYKNGGIEKLRKLMGYDNIYIAIEKEFGIDREDLNKFLRDQITLNKD